MITGNIRKLSNVLSHHAINKLLIHVTDFRMGSKVLSVVLSRKVYRQKTLLGHFFLEHRVCRTKLHNTTS